MCTSHFRGEGSKEGRSLRYIPPIRCDYYHINSGIFDGFMSLKVSDQTLVVWVGFFKLRDLLRRSFLLVLRFPIAIGHPIYNFARFFVV